MRVLSSLLSVLGFAFILCAYAIGGIFWPLILWVIFFFIWVFWIWHQWTWIHSPGLLLILCFGVLGFYQNFSTLFILLGIFFAFAGWDLADFSSRLINADPDTDFRLLKKEHLVRLCWVLGLGLTLILMTIIIRLHYHFGWMVFLSLLTALGLGRMISRILKT